MPTPRRTLRLEQLREHLRAGAFRIGSADLVGVEVELTPFSTFAGELDLELANSGVDGVVTEALASRDREGPYWRSGLLSREPGGQLEYSGLPRATPEAAAWQTSRAVKGLRALGRRRGLDLVAVGFHPWKSAEAIGLRTQAPRYRAMQSYFDSIGPWGRRMMRQTGSIQVNIDFGTFAESSERWELAQRLVPILSATFANSAVEGGRPAGVVGLRGESWLNLDPSRTGIPSRFLEAPDENPLDQYLAFALGARVMWVARKDGTLEISEAPRTFGEWMHSGDWGGFPDMNDWQTHLSTLFPDVRAKGYLELRCMDVPGYAWLDLPTLLVGHALRESGVRRALLRELRPLHDDLPMMRDRASRLGLADPDLREAAARLFELVRPVLDGPGRRRLDAFVERYVRPGLSPGEELCRRIETAGVLDPADYFRLERERMTGVSRLRGLTLMVQ